MNKAEFYKRKLARLRPDFQKFMASSGYCSPPGRAACALHSARVLQEWRDREYAGLVRLQAIDEQENYFDVYGKPDSDREYKELCRAVELNGCYCVYSEYFDGQKWQRADSIGMCVYDRPLDPFDNDYVIDLMASAIELIPQSGEH